MYSKQTYRFPFGKYPAIRLSLLMVLGILAGSILQSNLLVLGIGFSSIAFLQLFFDWKNKKWLSVKITQCSTLLFCVLIILFGHIRYEIQSQKKDLIIIDMIEVSPWQEMQFRAHIEIVSKNSSGKYRAEATIQESFLKTGLISRDKFKARLLLPDDLIAFQGDNISFLGTIIPISEKRNPLQFDYKAYLESNGIVAQIRIDSLISQTPNNNIYTWNWWRVQALKLVDQNFSGENAAIAKALLLGYKQELEGESKQAFARAGLSHIMAVSGLHVGFVIAPFWFIIPFLWSRKFGRLTGFICLIFVLYFYAGLTGFSASVLRASIMAILLTFGKLFYKSANSINLTGAAAIILLIIDPSQLFEIGFQLSFAAVLIILLVLPVIQNTLPYWLRLRWYAKPLMVAIVSMVVQIGLYPIQVFYFGEISLVSPLANALFVPLLGLVVPFSLICLAISIINPFLGALLNYPSDVFLQAMNTFVHFSSALNWAWMKTSLGSLLLFPFWLALIFCVASWRTNEIRWKWLSVALSLFCLLQFESVISKFDQQELRVTVFDVGQGDAALIETPNKKSILIDTGVWNPGFNSGESIILPYLKENGIEQLDAVILSHPHADHIGGILSLIEGIEIDTIYNSGYEYESNLYKNYLNSAKSNGIPIRSIQAGDHLTIDPSLLLLVLGPEGPKFNSDPNQHSVVMNLIYGKTEFLFTGDAGEDQEERLIENYGDLLDTDFLKVGHHGSRTSSGFELLKQVTPEIATVSLAERNRFKHPHPEAVLRIQATGTELYFTSRDKALIFVSDGKGIWREVWD